MGGPYPVKIWTLGSMPTVRVDIPITSVFMALFLACAAIHILRFRKNLSQKKRFFLTPLIIGYSMSRVIACILRITTTALPKNINVLVAYTVFLNVGVVLMYLLNLALARRIIRAKYPFVGFHLASSILFWALCGLLLLTIAMVLTVIIQSFFTLNARTRLIDRRVQLAALTIFAAVSFLPLPVAFVALLIPDAETKFFANNNYFARAALLFSATFITCLGAAYRCAVTWMNPVPINKPKPGYMHLACFYVFYFAFDFIIITMHALARVERLYIQSSECEDKVDPMDSDVALELDRLPTEQLE